MLDSREHRRGWSRRRQCLACEHRFSTLEIVARLRRRRGRRELELRNEHLLPSRQQTRILELLREARAPLSARQLAEGLYPDEDGGPESSLTVVAVQVNRIRERLGRDAILRGPGGYVLGENV